MNLISDVLDINKIQSGMLTLLPEEDVNLYPLLDAATSTAETLIKDKPIVFVQDIDSDLPAILCNPRRVRQVLLNLLSNAAKFTDEGTITLSAKRKGSEMLFAVIDTGAGIPEDQRQTIFDPFVQTETGIKHAGGTGLGLPISKSLVEAHDGRIWLESELGEDSSFMVALPVKRRCVCASNPNLTTCLSS